MSAIIGLAFVFHSDDSVIRQLAGIRDTYCVSSVYDSRGKVICHCRSFHSFPSTHYPMLPSCCPSTIFWQLMRLCHKLQKALNTNAMKSKDVATIQIDNFDKLIWCYLTMDLAAHGINILHLRAVVTSMFMEKSTLIVQKKGVSRIFHSIST